MKKLKELDLGNSDFKNIIERDCYFVDKSLFIKEIIQSQKQVVLLPRPRRFGKTLNLSMLKYFFDINEVGHQGLFKNLKIWQTDLVIKGKMGKYPVIHISFKDAKKDSWKKTCEQIVSEIVNLYKQHLYLLNDNLLYDFEKIKFNDVLYGRASEVVYENSLKDLTEYLYRFHRQNVVVLVDEYDTPIQAGYRQFYDEAISFMRTLLSGAFKDNSYLYKGVITGILRVSRESIFTGLNNVSVYSVLDHQFSEQFGFTEAETRQVLHDFKVQTDYEQIKKWYDGYQFGKTSDIYNPWSILNYVQDVESGFKPYWVNTSSDELLKERLKEREADYTREQLLKLVNNETIEKTIDENFVFPDLDTDKELLWTLLTFSGYLTQVGKVGVNSYSLKIPNDDIKFVFKNIILKWLSVDLKIRRNLLDETTKYLISNQIAKFEKGFKSIIGDTFSYFDMKGEPENVYQSYVLGLLAIIGDDYIIKSNRESGEGRYDILLIPHDRTKYGVVIEIKQITKNENEDKDKFALRINSKIKEAQAQIEDNQYYKELVDCKVSNIIKLPIVFAGEEPFVGLLSEE